MLQQETFVLKRQFQVSEDCNRSLVYEMQSEISGLRDSLSRQSKKQQTFLRDSSEMESELKEQIQRQSKQLGEAGEREAEMKKEMRSVKENLQRERSNLDEHLSYIQTLKGEISLTVEKKAELEMHICELACERDNLSDSLEHSVGKIFSLERKQKDQENLLRSSERELEELRTSNHYLMEKLEVWSVSRCSSPSFRSSIMSELELSASDSDMSLHRW